MNELNAVARLRFHDGRLDEFKDIAKKIADVVRTVDEGTLRYEIYFNEDETECVFLEQYRDSEALIQHNQNLGELLGQMLATGSVTAEIYGEPSEELRAMMVGGPVRFFKSYLSC